MNEKEKKQQLNCPVADDRQGSPGDAMPEIAVLFITPDSIYKTLPGLDCYDQARDAHTWPGGCPVIAHPPCGSWGCFRHFVTAPPGEHELAPWALEQVRLWGGIIEHPAYSTLWKTCDMPLPGQPDDSYEGFTIEVEQFWWGHRARKRTWLYICGCNKNDVPHIPVIQGRAPRVIVHKRGINAGMSNFRSEVSKKERLATPEKFARWLVALARKCHTYHGYTIKEKKVP